MSGHLPRPGREHRRRFGSFFEGCPRDRITVVVCLWAVVASAPVSAWLRPVYEDATVVERSELIVVGRLKTGSIAYVPHEKDQYGASSWEHHARLVVSEVLKGETPETEIPIVIHYGLTPVVGGHGERGVFGPGLGDGRADDPSEIVEVFDTGNSAVSLIPLVGDAREDNIWFLRRRSGVYGQERGDGNLGIVDPEDLRPLGLKAYFLAYLGDAPEREVRRHQWAMVETERRAQRYLDHLAVRRALEIENVSERLRSLKRFYLARQSWNGKQEARDGIIAGGPAAAILLTEMFDDPALSRQRADMILLFREIGHRGAVPRLVRLLEAHHRFWQQAPIRGGRWDQGTSAEDEQERRRIYSEIYNSVFALGKLGDARAVSVVRATKRQWTREGLESDQIVEECDGFLNSLDELEKTRDGSTER